MKESTCGVILAGGQATRMGGGDKCLMHLGGHSLLSIVMARAAKQAGALVLNANGDQERFAKYDIPVVADTLHDGGPLAGVLAGMYWAREHAPQCRHVLSFAADTPFFPKTLARDLAHAMREQDAVIAVASSGGQIHPTFALWHMSLAEDLNRALTESKIRKIRLFMSRHRTARIDYPVEPYDPFFNINTPEDIKLAEKLARER